MALGRSVWQMDRSSQLEVMPKKVNQQFLINEVRKKGVTARNARKAVQTVFKAWKDAIAHWEDVETPCGILKVVATNGKKRYEHRELNNVNTKKKWVEYVAYPGRHMVVKLRPDPKLVVKWWPSLMLHLTPPPPQPPPQLPPPPETTEERECRELANALLPKRILVDSRVMARLQEAVHTHPRGGEMVISVRPGALRRRLRHFRGREWQFDSVEELAQQISEHTWI